MKKLSQIFVLAILHLSIAFFGKAQSDTILTVVGGRTSGGYSGDDSIATSASVIFYGTTGVCVDASGNIYVADYGNARVRKVDAATGIVHTIVGTGISGYSGDGGLAVNAEINQKIYGLRLDGAGNLYLSDNGNGVIRNISQATGKISTIAGVYGGGGVVADGIPATTAKISAQDIYVDNAGNVFFPDGNRIRKVDVNSGLVYTVAGSTVAGFLGDGGPATAASLSSPYSLTGDYYGNLYIADYGNNRIRKVNVSGIISTIAGTGVAGYTGDGNLAVLARLCQPTAIGIDILGNIYFQDTAIQVIRKIDNETNIINTIAGVPSTGAFGEDITIPVPAMSFPLGAYYFCLDLFGNIYYSDMAGWINKITNHIGSIGYYSDSFYVAVNRLCNGSVIAVSTNHYFPGMYMKTYFGDGDTSSDVILSNLGAGTATISHIYSNSGAYKVRHVLYHSGTAIDSLTYTYAYSFCRTIPVELYYDLNGNCIKDSNEKFSSISSLVLVDSNGITIDTVSAFGGFNYDAYGNPNDIYNFKFCSFPDYVQATCPASGIIRDTISSNNSVTKNFGLQCTGGSAYDLQLNAVIGVTGENDQGGCISVKNNTCVSTTSTVTLNFSPKYTYNGHCIPPPTTVSGNTLTWDLGAMQAGETGFINLNYVVYRSYGVFILPGDTVRSYFSITPISSDLNILNNTQINVDTVKSGCDPNEMFVNPPNCIPLDSNQLKYTINFENTGNDTAFNIVVMDTLSPSLDPHSIRIVSATAYMNIYIFKANEYNIVTFDFPNINLLDSSHLNCTGNVIFNINRLSSLPLDTTFENHAGIFFDQNPVVMTNTVKTIIGCTALSTTDIVKSLPAEIFPNPANGEISLKTPSGAYTSFTITNAIGQLMMGEAISSTQTLLNIKSLPPGLYYMNLKGDLGTNVLKFVKL